MMPIRLCESCCRDVGNTEDGWGNFCQECFDNKRRVDNGTLSLEQFRWIRSAIMHDEIHRLYRELCALQNALDNFAFWEIEIDQEGISRHLVPECDWEAYRKAKAHLLSLSKERRTDANFID